MNLAIIEDHNIIRETLKSYFNELDNFKCSLTSPSVEQFYKDFVKYEEPDILLLDIQLPGQDGHLAIPQLKHLLKTNAMLSFAISLHEKRDARSGLTEKGKSQNGQLSYSLRFCKGKLLKQRLLFTEVAAGATQREDITRASCGWSGNAQ